VTWLQGCLWSPALAPVLVGLCSVGLKKTNDNISCSSFGCHIAVSDVAPGFIVKEGNGGVGDIVTKQELNKHLISKLVCQRKSIMMYPRAQTMN